MESPAETPINDDGVVAPPQDENKDATNFNLKTDEAGTPVARKTRGALRHKMDATAEKVSPPNAGKTTELPPKTPGTPSSRLVLSSETPRRSCRKSVRPAIDYDDIVRSAKKLVPEEHPDAEDDEESTAQKWNAAEVGRSNSRKRNRKSKRAAKKKQKTGDVETGIPEGAGDEEQLEKQEEPEHQEDNKELECQKENKEELEHLEEKEQEVEHQEENKEEFKQQDEEKDELERQEEKKEEVENQENESSQNVVASKSTPKNDQIGVSPLSQVCSEEPGNEITPESFCKVTDADIDELGLCPLSQESNTDLTEDVKNLNNETKNSDGLGTCSMEVDNEDLKEVDKENAEGVNTTYEKSLEDMEDMPSLIMIDDEDSVGAENVQLNTTFDADDIKEDESVILIEVPGIQTTLEKPSVKVVLTTDDNKRETLLNMENSSPTVSTFTKRVSKGYRFPTPFKNKTSFKFSDEHKTSFDDGFFKKCSSQMLDMPLNTTFDADDIKEDESVILIEVPGIQTTLEKPSVKVVLTTDDNKRETLLNMENSSPTVSTFTKRVSKGYRFPTPFKNKTSFKFSDEHKTSFDDGFFKKCSSQMLDMPEPKQGRRRSKSASHMNDVFSKTVSFQSPIEIANVEDIDKRWEALNKKNITSRRKRSKSLEEKPSKFSRIPKPKIVTIGKVVTPSKVKRAKLPNFAAIHEKQFSKMESLVDHIERKAERAKVLTNSALKQATATKKHQATTSKVDSVMRPKALKKIDLSAKSVAVEAPKQVSVEAAKDKVPPSRLPLKNAANVPSRPAFNLSTSIVTSFNTTLSGRPAQDKLAERKQRHVEMFKGRTKDKSNKGDLIKGVRSNRRFELQMQHRRHITED
ncbi:caldesmon [Drosophila bipectinata]|uniref:caldesmon n=1 Tax=Drosophila bipectinata TaxID=42026 RepID=UPI001C89D5B1|nr:myb-like protein X [Drosophila bipectinata]